MVEGRVVVELENDMVVVVVVSLGKRLLDLLQLLVVIVVVGVE